MALSYKQAKVFACEMKWGNGEAGSGSDMRRAMNEVVKWAEDVFIEVQKLYQSKWTNNAQNAIKIIAQHPSSSLLKTWSRNVVNNESRRRYGWRGGFLGFAFRLISEIINGAHYYYRCKLKRLPVIACNAQWNHQ
jgi:hypothetical protein